MGERTETPVESKKAPKRPKGTSKPSKGPKKPRTEAQKEATRKMIEAGRAKRFKKASEADKEGSEAVKNGHKGGIASGEARRAYRSARETLMWANDQPLTAEEIAKLRDLGYDEEQIRGIRPLDIPTLKAKDMAQNGNLSAAVYVHDLIEGRIAQECRIEVKDTSKMSVTELIEYRRLLKGEDDSRHRRD